MLKAEQLDISECKKTPWDFGNKFLYDLCERNPTHENIDVVLAKIMFIGRIYAAAIERRRENLHIDNDNFYIKIAAPNVIESGIDSLLENIKAHSPINIGNMISILEVHKKLLDKIKGFTGLEKRSFCSKYLHFHAPELFFIYDSRAVNALKRIHWKISEDLRYIVKQNKIDKGYAEFFCKCLWLKAELERIHNMPFSNRAIDNMLIKLACVPIQ